MGENLWGEGNMYAAAPRFLAPARIDCDEWRLLWIPDRDRELGGRRCVLLNCFFPAAVSLDYWKPRQKRYEASAATLSVDIDCHLASPFPTGLVAPQNRFSQKTPMFPPFEIAQEMKLPRKTY